MIKAESCGGVVIFRGKILLLYKNINRRYEGWVLPKGTVEHGETNEQTALREVAEEAGIHGKIQEYLGCSEYSFSVPGECIVKSVHWYLMSANSYYSKPQREEFFLDSGFYKYHEAVHLLKFDSEREMVIKAYRRYNMLKKQKLLKDF